MSFPMRGAGPAAGLGGAGAVANRPSVAAYTDYLDAQRAVDYLADNGFPVQHTGIVGSDLKMVESVTGRMSYPRAAGAGALSGAWFGMLIGLMITLFSPDAGGAVLFAAAGYGAAFGVIYSVLAYAMTRGRRDFSSRRQVVATRFDVVVERAHFDEARGLLLKLQWQGGPVSISGGVQQSPAAGTPEQPQTGEGTGS